MTTCKASLHDQSPEEDKWEVLYKKQLHLSDEMNRLTALYLHDTVQKGEAAGYPR